MVIPNIKSLIRALIGVSSILFIRNQSLSRDRFYCNLILDRVDGGPNRFLKNLITSKLVKDKLSINNWSLKGCSSALVFSGSWGNSFSKVCKYRSIKTILRVDGFFVPDDSIDLDYQHSRKFQKRMNKRLALDLKQFDHIIYQSNFSKEICDKYLFNRKDDFSIISNGTDLDHFKPYGNNNNDRLKIILVAKYYPKHLDLALSIFKQIFKHINADMTIVGVMRDGTEGVKDYVEKSLILNLEKPNVSCKSFVKADVLPKLLSSHDIFLHVKVGDWCPNAVIEAMGCGLPVVCPSWGGTKEIIGNAGISADGPEWGVDETLIVGLAEAVIKISQDLDFYKKNARKCALEKYSIDDVSSKYLKLLNLVN